MGNMQSDFNDNNKTSSLYNTNYINQVRRKKVNANVSDDSFKAYDACDTMDETRELNETELMDNYSSDYKNI
jgi:hypothetical protein